MTAQGELTSGVRVLDLAGTLAGVYAAHLLAETGATVTRVAGSPLDLGDPGTGCSSRAREAFGRLLTEGREIVSAPSDTLHRVDVVIDTGDLSGVDARRLSEEHPDVVVVSVTDYGLTGPRAGQRASSQILQAQSGSTSARGIPEWAPLVAAGETEQFLAGAYAASAALAALAERDRTGRGDLLDLSLLEVCSLGHTLYYTTSASLRGLLGTDFPLRSTQVPGNERTADGWVGFSAASARMRQDFLLVIGREDLADDDSSYGNENPEVDRQIRRDAAAWAAEQTTEEVIALASALRIPVAPLANGRTIAENEQLRSRGFYRIDTDRTVLPGPTFRYTEANPCPGAEVRTETDAGRASDRRTPTVGGDGPLTGIRVIDLTAFWAGPMAANLLAALGAETVKVESTVRPDMQRFAFVDDPQADQWWERGPVFFGANTNKRGITIDFTREVGREVLTQLLEQADVLLENFAPRVLDAIGLDWDRIRARNPGLIVVRMPAFGLDGPWRDRTGFAQTIEQSSGLSWITGHPDGPPVPPRGICDPLAGVHAAYAALAALRARVRTGLGGLTEVSMLEPATIASYGQSLAWQLDGELVERIGNRHHRFAPHGLYATAGEDEWLCVAVSTDAQWVALTAVLGIPALRDAAFDDVAQRLDRQDEIDAVIGSWAASRRASDAVDTLTAAGVPAARVDGGGRSLQDPQFAHREFFEYVDHPVAGRHPVPGLPFRSARHPGPWNRTPAPTLGEHTSEVLAEWLGYDQARIADLFETGISGTRPANAD
ncbi:MAG: CoA transferase [Microbacterium sp.]